MEKRMVTRRSHLAKRALPALAVLVFTLGTCASTRLVTGGSDGVPGSADAASVAEVGSTGHPTLQDAFEAACAKEEAATIRLLAPIDLGESTIEFFEDTDVTLDLNGQVITCDGAQSAIRVFRPRGASPKLTVIDTAGGGAIRASGAARAAVINEDATLVINGGAFENDNPGRSYAIDSTNDLVIEGDGISLAGRCAIKIRQSYCCAGIPAQIGGGTYAARGGAALLVDASTSGLAIDITGGTFAGTNAVSFIGWHNAKVNVSGGRLEGGLPAEGELEAGQSINITGNAIGRNT